MGSEKNEGKADYKYNVAWLAKKLDREPASIRVALRSLEIDTNKDGVYGWNDLKKAEGVLEQLKARSERAPAAPKKAAKKKSKKAAKKKTKSDD